jgi:CheY-like chemotaxis protein
VSPSILITDDDLVLRQTLGQMLEPLGYQLRMAGDGEEALSIISHGGIDLLLCDYQMPRLTGIETIQQLRQQQLRLPCILLSASLDEVIHQRAKELDTFSVLAKPVTRQVLRTAVQDALRVTYGW